MNNTTAYTIKLIGRDYPLYLRKKETTLSGYTRYIEEAKVFKTMAGAERWLTERPEFPGRVVAVLLKRTLRGTMLPVGA
jgi:hypothetical protein